MSEIKSLKIVRPKHGKGVKYIEVNGKKFVLDASKENQLGDVLNFKELIDFKEYEETLDLIAEKISKKTDVKKMIKQALCEMPMKQFKQIKEEMEKEKPKIRNNEGCFFLTVGKTQLHLRD